MKKGIKDLVTNMLMQIYRYRQNYQLAEYISIGISWTHIDPTLMISSNIRMIVLVFHTLSITVPDHLDYPLPCSSTRNPARSPRLLARLRNPTMPSLLSVSRTPARAAP
jgi:hypothetical protein